jgi:uncharacterized membrane protein YgcG
MKKFLVFLLLTTFSLLGVKAQDVPPKPNPPKLVNDFANQLNAGEKAQLEQKLVAYNDSTSSQIVIVIIPTTGDYRPEDLHRNRWRSGRSYSRCDCQTDHFPGHNPTI